MIDRRQSIRRLAVAAGLSLAISLIGCTGEETPPQDEAQSSQLPQASPSLDFAHPATLRGYFEVYYSVMTSEAEGYGTGDRPQKASAIHFYPDYIVIESEKRGGRIISIHQIKKFRWD